MCDDNSGQIPEHAWERLALVPSKLRKRGFGWLAKRVREEAGRTVHVTIALIARGIRRILYLLLRTQLSKGTLFAIYDLDYFPISYDICWFMVWAELERKRRGMSRLQCVFVPCRDEATRKYPEGYNEVVDSQSRAWRFNNICTPVVNLVPGASCVVCNDRAFAKDFDMIAQRRIPGSGWPALSAIYRQTIAGLTAQGSDWEGLSGSVQGHRYVQQWLEAEAGNRKPVVITLRQYGVDLERNSAIEEWAAFAGSLDLAIYQPIIVPDTDSSMIRPAGFEGMPYFLPAAWNVGLRMAIYEMAYVNMFVNSGPGSMCILNRRCRYIFFKVTAPTYLASEDMLRQMGFERGTNPGFATPFQKWVWEPDSRDVLRCEFDAMAARIDAADLTLDEDTAYGVSSRRDRSAA